MNARTVEKGVDSVPFNGSACLDSFGAGAAPPAFSILSQGQLDVVAFASLVLHESPAEL